MQQQDINPDYIRQNLKERDCTGRDHEPTPNIKFVASNWVPGAVGSDLQKNHIISRQKLKSIFQSHFNQKNISLRQAQYICAYLKNDQFKNSHFDSAFIVDSLIWNWGNLSIGVPDEYRVREQKQEYYKTLAQDLPSDGVDLLCYDNISKSQQDMIKRILKAQDNPELFIDLWYHLNIQYYYSCPKWQVKKDGQFTRYELIQGEQVKYDVFTQQDGSVTYKLEYEYTKPVDIKLFGFKEGADTGLNSEDINNASALTFSNQFAKALALQNNKYQIFIPASLAKPIGVNETQQEFLTDLQVDIPVQPNPYNYSISIESGTISSIYYQALNSLSVLSNEKDDPQILQKLDDLDQEIKQLIDQSILIETKQNQATDKSGVRYKTNQRNLDVLQKRIDEKSNQLEWWTESAPSSYINLKKNKFKEIYENEKDNCMLTQVTPSQLRTILNDDKTYSYIAQTTTMTNVKEQSKEKSYKIEGGGNNGFFNLSVKIDNVEKNINLLEHFQEISWSMQVTRADINRSWFDLSLFNMKGAVCNGVQDESYSNGSDDIQNLKGSCCLIPIMAVIAKNVEYKMEANNKENSEILTNSQKEGKLRLGFFEIGGNQIIEDKQSGQAESKNLFSIKIPGPSVIGYVCGIVPSFPPKKESMNRLFASNPSPKLNGDQISILKGNNWELQLDGTWVCSKTKAVFNPLQQKVFVKNNESKNYYSCLGKVEIKDEEEEKQSFKYNPNSYDPTKPPINDPTRPPQSLDPTRPPFYDPTRTPNYIDPANMMILDPNNVSDQHNYNDLYKEVKNAFNSPTPDSLKIQEMLRELYKINLEQWYEILNEFDLQKIQLSSKNELAISNFLEKLTTYENNRAKKDTQRKLYDSIRQIQDANEWLFKYIYNKHQKLIDELFSKFGSQNSEATINSIINSGTKLIETIGDIKIYEKFSDTLTKEEINNAIVLLAVGQTGSGKTTLINAMCTYLLGIEFEDKVRFKLIREQTGLKQTESQTSEVKEYRLRARRIQRSLIFIDTPGFGDTQGIERDREIQQSIFDYLTRTQLPLHGICFVIKATVNRLTAMEKYIADNVLTHFGIDAKDNFIGMYTFSDGTTPSAKEALRQSIPISFDYEFNNSGIIPSDNSLSESIAQTYFDSGCKNFQLFFNEMYKITPCSLSMTKQVIILRNRLKQKLLCIRNFIDSGLLEASNLDNQMIIFKNAANQYEQGKKNLIYKKEIQKVRVYNGKITSTCEGCQYTCHENCRYSTLEDKKECISMNEQGFCENCPNKCPWYKHINAPYKYVDQVVEITDENTIILLRDIQNGVKSAKKEIEIKANELEALKKKIVINIKAYQECVQALDKIALKTSQKSIKDYIEYLIEQEKQKTGPGSNERMNQLEKLIKDIKTVEQIADGGNIDEIIKINQYLNEAMGSKQNV